MLEVTAILLISAVLAAPQFAARQWTRFTKVAGLRTVRRWWLIFWDRCPDCGAAIEWDFVNDRERQQRSVIEACSRQCGYRRVKEQSYTDLQVEFEHYHDAQRKALGL